MDKLVNTFFKIRGSTNTSTSTEMPIMYVAEDMDKRIDTTMAWSMAVIRNPVWSLGFHFCDEEVEITPSLLKPPHKHVHTVGDECLCNLKICSLSKFVDFGKWTLWFSYRSKFPEIENSLKKNTSDLGWGCMHRSAQMLIAQAFSSYLLGTNWRIRLSDPRPENYIDLMGNERVSITRNIIKLFADDEVESPFSIHNLVRCGVKYGKTPSEWFGPATTGRVLNDIFENEQPVGFAFYLAEDGIIDETVVQSLSSVQKKPEKAHWLIDRMDVAKIEATKSGREGKIPKKKKKQNGGGENGNNDGNNGNDGNDDVSDEKDEKDEKDKSITSVEIDDDDDDNNGNRKSNDDDGDDDDDEVAWRPTIIFIPLKLGCDEHMNPKYIPSLTAMFKLPQSIGMIGGKPHTSLYFFAAQDDVLHYLDPHRVQEMAPSTDHHFNFSSWMLPETRWIKCKDLDPSLAIGFLILSKRDFYNFKRTVEKMFKVLLPLFGFVEDANALVSKKSAVAPPPSSSSSSAAKGDVPFPLEPDDDDDDDFEIIN